MDLVGAFMWRIAWPLNKDLFARIWWAHKRPGDHALRQVVDMAVMRGAVTVDIGAAYGAYTHRLAKLVGPEGEVHAFEPNPSHWPGLAAAGRKPNVTLHKTALSDESGRRALHVPVSDSGEQYVEMGSLENRAAGGEVLEVELDTLDNALGSLPRLDFIKCDVEGHEHAVLEGGRDLLTRHQPTLVVEIEQRHRERPMSDTFSLLSDLGYTGWALTERGPMDLTEFDVERDQLRLIADDPETLTLPDGYVNDFVFAPAGRDVPLPR